MDEILESMTDIAKLHNGQYNAAAIATSLNSLNIKPSENEDRGWGDDWIDVKCSDGTKARILKNPDKAFELYATEWSTKFNVVADLLQANSKASTDVEINKRIVQLFNNLDYVEASLREMYRNAYLTFAASPCSEKSQEEKRRMDRIIAAASLHLVGLKIIIETAGIKDIASVYAQFLKLYDKLIDLISK